MHKLNPIHSSTIEKKKTVFIFTVIYIMNRWVESSNGFCAEELTEWMLQDNVIRIPFGHLSVFTLDFHNWIDLNPYHWFINTTNAIKYKSLADLCVKYITWKWLIITLKSLLFPCLYNRNNIQGISHVREKIISNNRTHFVGQLYLRYCSSVGSVYNCLSNTETIFEFIEH